jgi:glycosyltransferase involved in cell wall biosynthesis
MKIAFIHRNRAALPELIAYQSFFQSQNIQTCIVLAGEEAGSGADVYWYMMGYYPKTDKKKIIIHEYASASVPPYRKTKDFLKSRLSSRPHFRLYLNEYVREQINIHDGVPFGYRDMGVSDMFFRASDPGEKEYDFIYTGDLSSGRKLDILLRLFEKGDLRERSIVLLGHDDQKMADRYKQHTNILFRKAVPWEQVPFWLAKARFSVNFIPDEEPFNAQTPTKFLEYAAMKIPVISTNYYWISEFQERYGGNYFLLKEDLSNMTWDRILAFPYAFPDLHSWRWEEKIRASGVLEFLQQANRGPGNL